MAPTLMQDWQASYSARPHPAAEALVPATSLRTTAQLGAFHLGTGTAIFEHLTPSILNNTTRELLLVTCFWAASPSLSTLRVLLRGLSAKAVDSGNKIRVRICFSSRSLWQKLLHTRSPAGYIYPPSSWESVLGLPSPSAIPGLDLQIKSIFITPFSVMHPKFIVCDRSHVILPSCNVSWEDWFEGAMTLQLPHCNPVVGLWRSFWGGSSDFQVPEYLEGTDASIAESGETLRGGEGSIGRDRSLKNPSTSHDDVPTERLPSRLEFAAAETDVLFLPHPHKAWPRFRLWPLPPCPAPKTPLNDFTLHLLEHAEREVWMVTPNLTAPPAIAAIKGALRRGIAVVLNTNQNLMVAEQLVTAFTTTAACIKTLCAWHQSLKNREAAGGDLERGCLAGTLEVNWFVPTEHDAKSELQTRPSRQSGSPDVREVATPVKSHLKMTVVDDETMILGSGNLDRASWFTSQELGYAMGRSEVVVPVKRQVQKALEGRLHRHYPNPS